MVADERLVAVTHRSIAKYLDENQHIHFRFIVSEKNSLMHSQSLLAPVAEVTDKKNEVKKAQTPISTKPKGPIKPKNMVKRSTSAPVSASKSASNPEKPRVIDNWDLSYFLPKPTTPTRLPINTNLQDNSATSVHTAPACLSAAASKKCVIT